MAHGATLSHGEIVATATVQRATGCSNDAAPDLASARVVTTVLQRLPKYFLLYRIAVEIRTYVRTKMRVPLVRLINY